MKPLRAPRSPSVGVTQSLRREEADYSLRRRAPSTSQPVTGHLSLVNKAWARISLWKDRRSLATQWKQLLPGVPSLSPAHSSLLLPGFCKCYFLFLVTRAKPCSFSRCFLQEAHLNLQMRKPPTCSAPISALDTLPLS